MQSFRAISCAMLPRECARSGGSGTVVVTDGLQLVGTSPSVQCRHKHGAIRRSELLRVRARIAPRCRPFRVSCHSATGMGVAAIARGCSPPVLIVACGLLGDHGMP